MTKVFVFGSNLAGRHGRGAARFAYHRRGAKYGQGEGLQGDSYAIPTKDASLQVLPLKIIEGHVQKFLGFALQNSHIDFELTPIGCGLAGYKPEDIAPMFADAPPNVELPESFILAIEAIKGAR